MLPRRIKGITWFEIGGVAGVVLIVGVAAYVMWGRHAIERSRAALCQENILRIGDAVDEWAVENNKTAGTTVTMRTLVGMGLLKKPLRCRAGGSYGQVFTVGGYPECNYTPPAWFDVRGGRYRHHIHTIY